MVWVNDVAANLIMTPPEEYRKLVKCGCKNQCASNRCQCRRAGLQCKVLCSCYNEDDEPGKNVHNKVVHDDEEDN